jgi:hypothetical protein
VLHDPRFRATATRQTWQALYDVNGENTTAFTRFGIGNLEFDIKGLFDNLPHDLLLKTVRENVECKWALLYIERWLTAPMEKDGERIERTRGTPQGA